MQAEDRIGYEALEDITLAVQAVGGGGRGQLSRIAPWVLSTAKQPAAPAGTASLTPSVAPGPPPMIPARAGPCRCPGPGAASAAGSLLLPGRLRRAAVHPARLPPPTGRLKVLISGQRVGRPCRPLPGPGASGSPYSVQPAPPTAPPPAPPPPPRIPPAALAGSPACAAQDRAGPFPSATCRGAPDVPGRRLRCPAAGRAGASGRACVAAAYGRTRIGFGPSLSGPGPQLDDDGAGRGAGLRRTRWCSRG